MIGRLPEHIEIDGYEYPLRTDYRNVLDVLIMFSDPELTAEDKWFTAVFMLLEEFRDAQELMQAVCDGFDIVQASEGIRWFIMRGNKTHNESKNQKPLYDWEQDEQMIFAAVNNVSKMEVREADYMHWWTFLAYFDEIGEGIFSFIVGIRKKQRSNKKLEKHEQQFYRENKELVDIHRKLSKEEQQFADYIGELL